MKSGIYKITNPKGKIYIGKSTNLKIRQQDYKYGRNSVQTQRKLWNSIQKYSWENHTFEIIENCPCNILNEREIYWGNYYDVRNVGLNIRPLGEGLNVLPQETKDRISKSNRKSVLQFDLHGNFIKEWEGEIVASTSLGIINNNINRNVLGENLQAGGFIWIRKTTTKEIKTRLKEVISKISSSPYSWRYKKYLT